MQQPSSTTTLTTRRTTTTTTTTIMAMSSTTPPSTITAAQHLTQEALGGLAAGVIGTIIGYPLDVMKTRLQTSGGTSNNNHTTTWSTNHGRFRGLTLVADIVRTEGLVGLYRGVGPPLVSLSLLNTMSFTSYGYFRNNVYGGTDGFDIRNAWAGVTGAPAFALISTVENRLKTQLQVQRGGPQQQPQHYYFRNSWQCAIYLVRHDGGVSSLYKGHVVNTLREAVFVANYFFVYEGVKEWLLRELLPPPLPPPPPDAQPPGAGGDSSTSWKTMMILLPTPTLAIQSHQLAIPLAGGIAGASSWAVSFPLDCVRAGVQGQTASSSSSTNISGGGGGGALTVFRELVRRHGLAGLYQGVGPSIARAFLVSGSRFSAYEGAVWLLRSSSSSSGSE